MTFVFSHYLLVLVVFLIVDLLWLGVIAKNFYNRELGPLRAESTNWWAAGAFYLLYNLGLLLFAVSPAAARGSLGMALGHGALYGFFTYMTYDLTNLATLEDWPWRMSLVDIIWGTGLCTSVAGIVYLLIAVL
jgi:uncharacterized membrane protein